MNDAGKVIGGLVIFLLIVTLPMWYQLAMGEAPVGPDPVIAPGAGATCVAEADYMRAKHMDLLNQWRDDVVRKNHRTYVGLNGKEFDMSLSRTCIGCHSNKTEFCDRCHDYTGVDPYCWECHVEPMENQ